MSTDGKDKMMDIKIPHFRILSLLDKGRYRCDAGGNKENIQKAPIVYCDDKRLLSEP